MKEQILTVSEQCEIKYNYASLSIVTGWKEQGSKRMLTGTGILEKLANTELRKSVIRPL